MADLAAVFNIVSRASALALELYKFATTAPNAVNNINKLTRSISSFASTVKQVGAIIREDDSLPSHEAIEVLNNVLQQCNSLLTEVQFIFPLESSHSDSESKSKDVDYRNTSQDFRLSFIATARLDYVTAHLDCLKSTLSVLIQTMHTAQSVIWAMTRPTISPQQAARAVANEKMQLETLVIEQQTSILSASTLYAPTRPDARLLMEVDSSQSLISTQGANSILNPADLFRYQVRFVEGLDALYTTENDWLLAICGESKTHFEHLLDRWTRLRQLQERIDDEERMVELQRRESLQPTVESDVEDGVVAGNNNARLTTPTPGRTAAGGMQPLFTETTTFPIPVPDSNLGPTTSFSPASLDDGTSPGSSGNLLSSVMAAGYSAVSPRSSISSLPAEAAAAIEAKENDDEVNLEIPWRICTRQHYWDFVDNKLVKKNTHHPPPTPVSDRNGSTEILASWVCKEAITEAGFKYTKAQRDRPEGGRRTKYETLFVIQQSLSFHQVQ
ncbi:hypothetical protein K504DRAFT_361164, partial [Pleomassaria siparia CBS 279.74]